MMKIGELAVVAQCTVETIRHYETERLIPKPERGANNYRIYGQRHLDMLTFIRNCRAFDLSQNEIRELLDLTAQPEADCDSANAIVDEDITHVSLRIDELRKLKAQFTNLRQKCRIRTHARSCRILKGIATSPTAPNRKRASHV